MWGFLHSTTHSMAFAGYLLPSGTVLCTQAPWGRTGKTSALGEPANYRHVCGDPTDEAVTRCQL